MHNKKLKGSIAMLALSAVLVGGTFAWLGATDSVKNIFTTVSEAEVGVDIWELKTDSVGFGKPADSALNKRVQVQNTADHNTIIRVDFDKYFIENRDAANQTIVGPHGLKDSNIQLLFSNNLIDESELAKEISGDSVNLTNLLGKWVKSNTDGKYYYIGNVLPQGYTTEILSGVYLAALNDDGKVNDTENTKLLNDANYRNARLNVDVMADNIQSTAEAITSSKNEGITTNGVVGFGLDSTKDANLIKVLEAVVMSEASQGSAIQGATATGTATER